jgi:hypothetical protein
MGLFDYVKDCLSSNIETEDGELISKEPLKRADTYEIPYNKWVKTGKPEEMLKSVRDSFDKKRGCPTKRDKSICFLMIPTINGFTMHYNPTRWETDDFKYFFEYLYNLVLKDFGYEVCSSTQEKTKYPNHVETVERHCLETSDTSMNYSNILLRLCYTNNQITSIKFCATCAPTKKPDFGPFLKKMVVL